MLNNSQNQKSCTVAHPSECNYATQGGNRATANATTTQLSEAMSLKALAEQVLVRHACNSQCNSSATVQKMQCNFSSQNDPQKLHESCMDNVVDIAVKHKLNVQELANAAGEDWEDISQSPEQLEAFADAIAKRKLMEQGIVPDDFTALTTCRGCGAVPVHPAIANGGNVLGCPWCWNRAYNWPMPQISVKK